jgi:hypothetical protein
MALAVWVPVVSSQSRPSAWLDVSLVHDDNVFETMSGARPDISARLLFQCSWKRRLDGQARLALNVQGAAEAYRRYSKENRSLTQVVLGCETPLKGSVWAGFDSDLRFKTFFEADRGYAFFKLSPFVRWRIRQGWNATVFSAASRLNFFGGGQYDYTACIGGASIHWAADPNLLVSVQCVFGEAFYQRQAYGLLNWTKNFEQWKALDTTQKDPYTEVSLHFEWTQWLLLRCGFGYEINRSNSYGYAFKRPKANVLAVKSLDAGWTFGFCWTSQMKRYSDSLRPILQISSESENEENNCVLIDASKSLGGMSSVKFQAGWYRNESPFRDLYYQKILYSLGVHHTF